MKKAITLLVGLLLSHFISVAQNSVGVGTTNPDINAALDIQHGPNPQGMYMPRLFASQRDKLTGISPGLMVYDLDSLCLLQWDGSNWENLCAKSNPSSPTKISTRKYYSIPAAEFKIFDTQSQFAEKIGSMKGGSTTLKADNAIPGLACASINLPHGSQIDSLIAYINDGVNDEAEVELYKVDLFAPSPFLLTSEILLGEIISDTKTSGVKKYNRYISTDKLVNNEQYAYYIIYKQPTNQSIRLYGVTLSYFIQEPKL